MTLECVPSPPSGPLTWLTAYGLVANPFDPLKFGEVAQRLLDGLYEVPLAIDEDPALEELFVADAGPFATHVATFKRRLELAGYTPADSPGRSPKPGPRSFAFRVFGPRGSGKSTMTNKMIAWLKSCFSAEQLLEGQLRVIKRSVAPTVMEVGLDEIRAETGGLGGTWCCLALDDVRLDKEELLHTLFEELRSRGVFVILFEILHHAEDLRRPLPGARVGPIDLRTTGLTREHAEAFLTKRINTFRDPEIGKRLDPDLSTYPFDPNRLGALVGPDAAMTLRTLNQMLNEGLVFDLARRTSGDDVTQLDCEALRGRLIDLVAINDELYAAYRKAA